MCIGILGRKKVGYPGRIITVTIKTMKTPTVMALAMAHDGNTSGLPALANDDSSKLTNKNKISPSLNLSAAVSSFKVKKGEVHKALLIRTKKPMTRPDSRRVRFDDNAVILLNPDFSPIGNRLYGPIADEVRAQGSWAKVLSLATRVL